MTLPTLFPSFWGRQRENGDPFRSLHREIDRVFDDFTRGFALPARTGEGAMIAPRIDVSESDKTIEVTAELPGVTRADIDVSISENVLVIKGEKKSEREDKGEDYHMVERSYGSFRRSVPLPFKVTEGDVEASLDNGVLKVVVPKPAEATEKARRIDVK